MENSYTFINMPDKVCKSLEDKEMKESLMKWSMKGNLLVQYYNFNQPFQIYKNEDFVKSFFTDPVVYSTLLYEQVPIGKPAKSVSFESVPCTILSMDFFDRLIEPENNVVRCDGKSIIQCLEDDVDGFLIDDNLRNTILNHNSSCYNLYSESDRRQLLWRLLSHFCLGGEYCQHEFTLEPYLKATKLLYKELVSVERVGDSSELVIRSVVLKVEAYDENDKLLIPKMPENIQNFAYLIIDPYKRSVTVLSHHYGGQFYV